MYIILGETPSPLMTESQMEVVMHANRKVMGKLVWPEEENETTEEFEEIDFDSQVFFFYYYCLFLYCNLFVLIHRFYFFFNYYNRIILYCILFI